MTTHIVTRKLDGMVPTYAEVDSWESAVELFDQFRDTIKVGEEIRIWEVKPRITATRDEDEP